MVATVQSDHFRVDVARSDMIYPSGRPKCCRQRFLCKLHAEYLDYCCSPGASFDLSLASSKHSTLSVTTMNNKVFEDSSAPFMVRRSHTGEPAVLLFRIGNSSSDSYHNLLSEIDTLFSLHKISKVDTYEITKLEVHWLSKGVFPHRQTLNEKNTMAILRLILLRQGRDVVEATIERKEEAQEKRGY